MPWVTCDICCCDVVVDAAWFCPLCGSTLRSCDALPVSPEESLHHNVADDPTDEHSIQSDHEAVASEDESLAEAPEERGLLFLMLSPFGRIGRLVYVGGVLLVLGLVAIAWLVMTVTMPLESEQLSPTNWIVFLLAAAVIFLVAIKRVHDFEYSGAALLLVLFCGFLPVLLFLALIEGFEQRNRFGRPTRLRWNGFSMAAVCLIASGGVYSAMILISIDMVAENLSSAVQDYEEERLEVAGRQFESVYEEASDGQRLCPFCDTFTFQKMLSAYLLGDICSRRRKWDEAVDWLADAEILGESLRGSCCCPDIETTLVDIRIGLADALEAAGEYDKAVAMRTRAVGAMKGADPARSKAVEWRLAEGRLRLNQEEYAKAREIFTELIEISERKLETSPSDQSIRSRLACDLHNRAIARSDLGDLAGAQADLREAIRLQTIAGDSSPRSKQFSEFLAKHYSLLGSIYLERRDLAQASEMFSKGLEADPGSIDLRTQRAWLCYQRLEYREVIRLLESFLEYAEDVDLEYLLTVCLLKLNQNERASRVVTRVRSRHPKSVEARFLTGVVSMMEESYQPALDAFQEANRMKPQDPAILHDLAICFFHLNRTADAERTVAQLHDLDSTLATTVRRYFQSESSSRTQVPIIIELYEDQ